MRVPRSQLTIRWVLAVAAIAVIVTSPAGARGQRPELDAAPSNQRAVITPHNAVRLQSVSRLRKDDVYSIVPDRHPGMVALVGWEKPVEIRTADDLALMETIEEGKRIIHFAFSPKGRLIAYSENDRTGAVMVVDRPTGKTITLQADGHQPRMVFSPDGSLMATGSYDTAARLWKVEDGTLLRALDCKVLGGLTPEFSPDGRVIAVGNRNGSTRLFETTTGRELAVLTKPMSQQIRFHPKGHTLAVAYVDGSVGLWRVPDGDLIRMHMTKAEELYTLDWSPDGAILATAGRKGAITLWNPDGLSMIRELKAPDWVIQVRFSPDGRLLHSAGGTGLPGGERWVEVFGVEGP